MTEGATPPAGWYPVEGQPGSERYWDGGQWTDAVRAVDATTAMPTSANPTTMLPTAEAQQVPVQQPPVQQPPVQQPPVQQPPVQQPPVQQPAAAYQQPSPQPAAQASGGSSNRGLIMVLVGLLGIAALGVIGLVVFGRSSGDDTPTASEAEVTTPVGEGEVTATTGAAAAGSGTATEPLALGSITSVTDRTGVATWDITVTDVVTLGADDFFSADATDGQCVAVVGTATLVSSTQTEAADFFTFPEVAMIDDGAPAAAGFLPCDHSDLASAGTDWIFEIEANVGDTVSFYSPFMVSNGDWDSLAVGEVFFR